MGAIILSIGHNGKVGTIGCVFEMSELGSACFVCWVLINKTQPIWQYFSFFFVVCFVFPASNHKVKNFSSFLPYVRCFVLPTSNHNIPKEHNFVVKVVCLVFPTSDHNSRTNGDNDHAVVCLVLPTSNHNLLRRYSFLFYRGKIIKFSEINNVCLNKKRTSWYN